MATDTIPGDAPNRKDAATAYWESACAFELVQLDAERLSETAFALATAEAFNENAQAAFYALGQLADGLVKRTKAEGDHFTARSGKGRA